MDKSDAPRIPARTTALLQSWVDEFVERNASDLVHIKVAVQDGSDGRDTGLVVVQLDNGGADIYMQPAGIDSLEWEITLTARPYDLTLSPYRMAAVASQVNVATSLCTFLQFKSLEWDRMSGMR